MARPRSTFARIFTCIALALGLAAGPAAALEQRLEMRGAIGGLES